MILNISKFIDEDYRVQSNRLSRNFIWATLMLAFVVIVIPNSVRFISIPLIFFAAALALVSSGRAAVNSRLLVIWILSTFVTLAYVCIGILKGYFDAVLWTLSVYVVGPMLWLLICSKIFSLYSLTTVIRTIIFFGVFGGISVFIFYYMFLNYGADSLTWLIAVPNLEYKNGTAHATMHVFGSLMFISAGFFSAPQIIKQKSISAIVTFVFVAAAFLSGRSALLLSLALGFLVRFISRIMNRSNVVRNGNYVAPLLATFIVVLTATISAQYYDIDVFNILIGMTEKITTGGGEERVDQAGSLWEGIQDSWGLGAGHGVGVSVIRNDDDPWRYELLLLATIFRVGFVGAAIYAIPVVVIIVRYSRLLMKRKNSTSIDFIFGGFLASLIGSTTNPYYESFEFQWMLILPLVYFTLYGKILENSSLSAFQTKK